MEQGGFYPSTRLSANTPTAAGRSSSWQLLQTNSRAPMMRDDSVSTRRTEITTEVPSWFRLPRITTPALWRHEVHKEIGQGSNPCMVRGHAAPVLIVSRSERPVQPAPDCERRKAVVFEVRDVCADLDAPVEGREVLIIWREELL